MTTLYVFTCSPSETSASITDCEELYISSVVLPTNTPTTSAVRLDVIYGLMSGIIVIILLLIAATLGIIYMYCKKRKQYNLETTGLAMITLYQ